MFTVVANNHFLLKQTINEPKKNHLCAAIAEVRLVILIRCALAAFLTQATSTAVRLRNINIMLVLLNTTTIMIIIIIRKMKMISRVSLKLKKYSLLRPDHIIPTAPRSPKHPMQDFDS